MTQDTTRSARLEARIAPEALAIVRRAAELEGRSLSDFMVAAAQEARSARSSRTMSFACRSRTSSVLSTCCSIRPSRRRR
jgi:hypothetical protein